jgi:CHASE domain
MERPCISNQSKRQQKHCLTNLSLCPFAIQVLTPEFVPSPFNLCRFEDYAFEVIHAVHYEADSAFSVVSIVASTLTSHTVTSGAKWPFFTMPYMEIMGRESNELSGALQLTVVPLVTQANKAQWEAFSVENQTWIQEGVDTASDLNLLDDDKNEYYSIIDPITGFIFRRKDNDLEGDIKIAQDGPGLTFGPGQYGPVWQQVPAPHDTVIINFDFLSHSVFARVYHAMWETKSQVMSEVMDLSFLYGGAVEDNAEHPHSALLQPIYPTYELEEERNQDDIVGFVVAVMPWDSFFENLLPEDARGVVVVLQDSCGDVLTYLINGPEAVFIGDGDHHDPAYTRLGVTSEFAPTDKGGSNNTEHCTYRFTVYPTNDLEQEYTTSKPVVFSIVVVCVFLFTAGVFVMYDLMVERRQTKILATAKRTNKIVSAFFPAQIRDRILQEAQEQVDNEIKKKQKKSAFGNAPKSQLKTFLNDDGDDDKEGNEGIYESQPIADLFVSSFATYSARFSQAHNSAKTHFI